MSAFLYSKLKEAQQEVAQLKADISKMMAHDGCACDYYKIERLTAALQRIVDHNESSATLVVIADSALEPKP